MGEWWGHGVLFVVVVVVVVSVVLEMQVSPV